MFDPTYLIVFIGIPLVLGLGAQAWVKKAFADGSKIQASSGLTGAQTSQRMLAASNIHDVSVEGISGRLSDHYDPRDKTMRLSEPVGQSTSVAAVAVAAHETGHAIQDAQHETGFRLRGAIVPAVGFASSAWFPVLLLGVFLNLGGLFLIGAILFGAIVVFQLVTLPVEFGASAKAMRLLTSEGVIWQEQAPVARRVLTAAAMTYVVAALISIMQFLYLLSRR